MDQIDGVTGPHVEATDEDVEKTVETQKVIVRVDIIPCEHSGLRGCAFRLKQREQVVKNGNR